MSLVFGGGATGSFYVVPASLSLRLPSAGLEVCTITLSPPRVQSLGSLSIKYLIPCLLIFLGRLSIWKLILEFWIFTYEFYNHSLHFLSRFPTCLIVIPPMNIVRVFFLLFLTLCLLLLLYFETIYKFSPLFFSYFSVSWSPNTVFYSETANLKLYFFFLGLFHFSLRFLSCTFYLDIFKYLPGCPSVEYTSLLWGGVLSAGWEQDLSQLLSGSLEGCLHCSASETGLTLSHTSLGVHLL